MKKDIHYDEFWALKDINFDGVFFEEDNYEDEYSHNEIDEYKAD